MPRRRKSLMIRLPREIKTMPYLEMSKIRRRPTHKLR